MSILIDKETRLLIQGVTGNEGARTCRESLAYGTPVLAGVTPGKGGEMVEGVPVYNTVAEALTAHPEINTSLVVVPARFAMDAALESIRASIPLVVILTEHIPTQDTARMLAEARRCGIRVVGPSSVGIISPGKAKIGSIGSGEMVKVYSPGSVGVLSKSGGMTSEIALALTNAGLGQSTAVGIGADILIGSDFTDLLTLFAEDAETTAVVLFGEVGGTYEEQAADYIKKNSFSKPVVALIAGEFADTLTDGTVLGHAGTIVAKGRGSYASKVQALTAAGVTIVSTVEEISPALKRILT
ncbi:MAG: CoA-binding protein [Patescibacteria group bacterium]